MTPREEVLGRVRAALRGPGEPASDPAPLVHGYRTGSDADVPALVALLAERLIDYGSKVRHAAAGQLGATVTTALAERGATSVVIPAGLALTGPPGGLEFAVDDGDGWSAEALDAVDAVVTLATVAIAETGTIVLDGSAGQGRRALSLIPDYHLCIVHHSQVVGLVPQAFSRLDPRRPLTWISGPSATSDIELSRVEGVHGPRTLEVILVGPNAASPPMSSR